ncbi:ADENINE PHOSPHORIBOSYLTRANSFERASE [Salix koriyanagi]|uniref:adenine phosphoribosyltransferase n=1 Tax=Salix koriyanagi TaxID=2511006 RepID=A0A9Q1A5E6_9ROSI|nr:ADENINE PHOSPHORIBOSYLTRANSFERASE [Salix koriyanagi]
MFAAENGLKGDPRLQGISEAIRVVPHFPKPGIMFQDITTLLLDHKAFKDTVDIFVDRYRDMDISVVAGVEARGFMFGPAIALAIGAKFVPLRKPRKLPGEVISEAYELEYGTDCLEMHVGAVEPGERAIVIDDLVATGGTLSAAIRLLERSEAEVVECACVIGLREVKVMACLLHCISDSAGSMASHFTSSWSRARLRIAVEYSSLSNGYAQAQADLAAKKDDG